jgi:hypothetical protein
MFDPKVHLIQLPRRVKDPQSGQWTTRLEEYLEVKWRLVMFREKYPHGVIATEEVYVDLDRGYARYKATVEDGEGGKATGYGTETKADFTDYAERAETRALGRALALLGFGTQFVGADLTEGEHVADAPVAPAPNGSPPASAHPLPAGEETTPAVTQGAISKEAVDRLWDVAFKGCHEAKDAFASRIRALMRLPGRQLISKAFLQRSMSIEHYGAAMAYYELQLKAQVEADVPMHEPPPPAEGTPAVPSGADLSSASAPADDPAEQERAKLRAMAVGWGLPEREVDHVLTHHKDLGKARDLLWKARRPWTAPTPTPLEAAAAD